MKIFIDIIKFLLVVIANIIGFVIALLYIGIASFIFIIDQILFAIGKGLYFIHKFLSKILHKMIEIEL